jgi:hypothetical protein
MSVPLLILALGGSLSAASAFTELSFRAWLPALFLLLGEVANHFLTL